MQRKKRITLRWFWSAVPAGRKRYTPIKADGIEVKNSFWLRTGTPNSASCISRTITSILSKAIGRDKRSNCAVGCDDVWGGWCVVAVVLAANETPTVCNTCADDWWLCDDAFVFVDCWRCCCGCWLQLLSLSGGKTPDGSMATRETYERLLGHNFPNFNALTAFHNVHFKENHGWNSLG